MMEKLPKIYEGYSIIELINLWGRIRNGTEKINGNGGSRGFKPIFDGI
ncbi:MAG: hypothetical protein IJS54_00220 [Desulfovibrio sp.]|nr:hypothetical protein [Desulfovibrio sp.]